ncbi:hypothetical protein TYRP_007956 [Tyrophagus putrescentiae]|nr:hypothetical protein TYRP_007956 [Tyrophagus putrescentiae]
MLRRLTKVEGLAPVPWRTCLPVSGRLMRFRSKGRPQLVVSAERSSARDPLTMKSVLTNHFLAGDEGTEEEEDSLDSAARSPSDRRSTG